MGGPVMTGLERRAYTTGRTLTALAADLADLAADALAHLIVPILWAYRDRGHHA